jgi:hypothetical protein
MWSLCSTDAFVHRREQKLRAFDWLCAVGAVAIYWPEIASPDASVVVAGSQTSPVLPFGLMASGYARHVDGGSYCRSSLLGRGERALSSTTLLLPDGCRL